MRSIRYAAIVAILMGVAALSITPVLATKGGNGHGNGKTTTATLTVTPNDAFARSPITVSGSGFEPNQDVSIKISENWCCVWGSVTADADGCFSFTTTTREPGTYKIWASEPLNKNKDKVLAYLEFEVVEQP